MISKNFKNFAIGSVLALTTAFSMPALAGTDFIKEDLRDRDTELVQVVGQRLSADKLTFVVHGGNSNLMGAAYRVAQRLDDEGVPVAFLLAPDRDGSPISMHVDYYNHGGTKFGYTAYDNDENTITDSEAGLYEYAMKAYNDDSANQITMNDADTSLVGQTLVAR